MVIEMRADQRSDAFSLRRGAVEMLTGERLFQGETRRRISSARSAEAPRRRSLTGGAQAALQAILTRSLERAGRRGVAAARRWGRPASTYLYDKGNGPTNLT